MSRDAYRELVPIVDVAYQSRITKDQLRTLAATLPHAVSLAVERPEEPYDGNLRPGDVIIRFQQCSPYDSADLDLLIEVRSKWFATRAEDRHQRCERLRDAVLDAVGPLSIGVYLSLPISGWAQPTSPSTRDHRAAGSALSCRRQRGASPHICR